MFKRHLPHPRVLRAFHRHRHPRVIFILGIRRIESGFQSQILHPHLADPAGPVVGLHPATAKIGFQRRRNRRIHRHQIALDFLNLAIPDNVPAARLPRQPPVANAAAKFRHPQRLNPVLRTRPHHLNCLMHLQAAGILHVKTKSAYGHIIIRHPPVCICGHRQMISPRNLNQRPTINPRRHQYRPVLPHPLPP